MTLIELLEYAISLGLTDKTFSGLEETKSKVCSKCNIRKPLTSFYKCKNRPKGHTSCCKKCKNKYMHGYNKKRRISKALYIIYNHQVAFAEEIKKGQNEELLVKCTYCGRWFSPTVREIENRIDALAGKQRGECRLYCCSQCKQACPSYNQKIKWKSNKSATSREVNAYFRQLVLERDNWTCQRCGKGTEAELHVHHIEGATQNPHLANDLENGITLCKACHKYIHTQDGCKYHELRCPV